MPSRPDGRASAGAGLLASFRHALRGVVEVAAHERNMKLHLCAGAAVGVLGSEVAFSFEARLALVLCVALVLAGETLNSALEALVDLHTPELRHEARRVKDAAAGVVFLLAAGAALTGSAVVAASWREIGEAWARVQGRVAVDVAAVACVALLLFAPIARRAAAAVAIAGAGSLLVVAATGVSLTFTVMALGIWGIAVAARFKAPLPADAARGSRPPSPCGPSPPVGERARRGGGAP
jgi:diacylglycerol kinase